MRPTFLVASNPNPVAVYGRGLRLYPTGTRKGAPVARIPRKVVKGGSYLCADSYCLRYRPAARRPQMVDTGMSHIGLRCVVRDA
jgi:formylglycine-generating enzyme required for sulfatase activity